MEWYLIKLKTLRCIVFFQLHTPSLTTALTNKGFNRPRQAQNILSCEGFRLGHHKRSSEQ